MEIKELAEQHSLLIYDGMIICYRGNEVEDRIISVSEITSDHDGCFSMNNSVIAFVFKQKLYVTPWTDGTAITLEENHFRKSSFYVPFSNNNYPKVEQQKWEQLLEEAETTRQKWEQLLEEAGVDRQDRYAMSNLAWSIEHNVGTITNIDHCFKVPSDGVRVTSPQGARLIVRPFSSARLGYFSVNNSIVAFVYCNGETYLAKGTKIVDSLTAAGYIESNFEVPLSNGEGIIDTALKVAWESLPEY